jgi:hypothetical protein
MAVGILAYFGFMNGMNRERERVNGKVDGRNYKVGR